MEQQLSATSILSLLETTKEQRQSFVQSVMSDIEQGYKNPLDIHLQIKCMEDLAAQLKEEPEYKKYLLEETKKQLGGEKSTVYHNAKFEIKEVGTKYDFTPCADPVLDALAEAADKAAKKLKERQEFLKKAPIEGTTVLDNETGEMITIYPPSKTSTTSVAVTLK